MPRTTIDLTDDEVATLLDDHQASGLVFRAVATIRAQSGRLAPNEEEEFLARARINAASLDSLDGRRLLALIDARDDLIHVLLEDGTAAQDHARGLERARCVEWLRARAAIRDQKSREADADGQEEGARLWRYEAWDLRDATDALAAEPSSPDDPP